MQQTSSVQKINQQQLSEKVSVQIVEGSEGISEFSKEWDDLFGRTARASVFLSRAWISTFIREGMVSGVPLFLLVWYEAKLVALLPLTIRKCLNVKVAEPVGTGHPSYLGLLLDPNYLFVTPYMADEIKLRKIFDIYFSEDLSSEDSATNELLDRLAEKRYCFRRSFRNPCRYARLGCSFEEYFQRNSSSKSRQNLLRRERRLFEKSDVKVEHYSADELTVEIIHRIAKVEQNSWLKRRGAAVLNKPFYQKLLLEMARAGFGSVWLMKDGDTDIAFEYVFTAHGKLQFLFRSFDLKYESSVSIGQILMMQVIRHACKNGVLSMDIGHGEADYKKFWAKDSHGVERVVASCGLMGYLIASFYYTTWKMAEIQWFRSFYQRIRGISNNVKQKSFLKPAAG